MARQSALRTIAHDDHAEGDVAAAVLASKGAAAIGHLLPLMTRDEIVHAPAGAILDISAAPCNGTVGLAMVVSNSRNGPHVITLGECVCATREHMCLR